MPSKKSSKKGKAKKAPAGKAVTFKITLPGKSFLMLFGVLAAMFMFIFVIGLLSPNEGITTRTVFVETVEEQLSSGQACEQAGGEVVPVQDCSVANVIQQDFGLKKNQVCCLKGRH